MRRKNRQEEIFEGLVLNAADFLVSAAKELKDSPKMSLLHFCAGVEMILKARLMHEHWALILDDINKADWDKFLQADFFSIGPSDAMRRIERITAHALPERAVDAVNKIVQARNKLAHFYNEDFSLVNQSDLRLRHRVKLVKRKSSQKKISKKISAIDTKTKNRSLIASMQCRAWHHIYEMTQEQWKDIFSKFSSQLKAVQKAMLENQDYLKERYDGLKDVLDQDKADGKRILKCQTCIQKASVVEEASYHVHETLCRVCDSVDAFILVDCLGDDCNRKIQCIDGCGSCKCGYELAIDELIEIFDENDRKDDVDRMAMAYCQYCLWVDGCPDGKSAISMDGTEYLCVHCCDIESKSSTCGWCDERYTGDVDEDTYLTGCEFCDGHDGWDKD